MLSWSEPIRKSISVSKGFKVILVVDVSINRLLLGLRVLKKEFVKVFVVGCLQASTIRQVADLVGQLDPNQTRELQVILQERLSNQARMVPEYFGDFPRSQSGVGFFGDGPTLPGLPAPNNAAGSGEAQDSWSSGRPVDVFAKTEKWLTPAPVPDTSKWSSRESEIMGFSEYLGQSRIRTGNRAVVAMEWSFTLGCPIRSRQE